MAYRQAKQRDTRAAQPATHTAGDARAGWSPRGDARTGTGPDPPGQPQAPRSHDQGTAPGSSSTQCYATAPRLGSLRASQWGSHWRQASSTGPAVPAALRPRIKGGSVVGKSLQPMLLDRGVAKSGSRGGKRQEVCHEGPPTRTRWGGYHLARPGGPPVPKNV